MTPLHERMRSVLRELALLPEGAAVDYSADRVSQGEGGHGKHGATSGPPPRVNSLAVEWADRFRLLVDIAERDLAHARTGAPATGPRVDPARDARIVHPRNEGRAAEWVALVEGCSASHVLKRRTNAGLDAHGFKRPAPLTSNRPPEEA